MRPSTWEYPTPWWVSFQSATLGQFCIGGNTVVHTSDHLADWWTTPHLKKAVLILDGLSLRELPFLIQGAGIHGLNVSAVCATASEIPAETTDFAQSLGFAQRSSLSNNSAGSSHRLPDAKTECNGLPWSDCANLIGAESNWVFWHHWPDSSVHQMSEAGQGLETLIKEAADKLLSDDFWSFIKRLATGRRDASFSGSASAISQCWRPAVSATTNPTAT